MERVAFLLEPSDQRIGCLLNPASLVFTRRAGVIPRRVGGGRLTRLGATDEPLLMTGGGVTELTLDLLFDVEVAGSSIETEDVRDLTRPLWNLAENYADRGSYGGPPVARFVWGKAWNVPGVVTAVAERLERFGRGGVPRRSWLRMRFVRVSEQAAATPDRGNFGGPPEIEDLERAAEEALEQVEREALEAAELVHEVVGSGEHEDEGDRGERIEEIAHRYFGDPAAWRVIAAHNSVEDAFRLAAQTVLRIPPRLRRGGR